jgi:hypothetical protein
MEINTGKFGKFEIISVRDHRGEGKPTEEQIDKIHTVPNIIITGNYKQDGTDVFVAESIIGVIHIKTSDSELIKLFNDGQKDNVAANLFQVFNPVVNTQPNTINTDGLLISKLDFGVKFDTDQLLKLKAAPLAIVVGIERFEAAEGVYINDIHFETIIGKYNAMVKDEAISAKLATAYVTGKSVDLFEKLEG